VDNGRERRKACEHRSKIDATAGMSVTSATDKNEGQHYVETTD
jgi:hypothetical protein